MSEAQDPMSTPPAPPVKAPPMMAPAPSAKIVHDPGVAHRDEVQYFSEHLYVAPKTGRKGWENSPSIVISPLRRW